MEGLEVNKIIYIKNKKYTIDKIVEYKDNDKTWKECFIIDEDSKLPNEDKILLVDTDEKGEPLYAICNLYTNTTKDGISSFKNSKYGEYFKITKEGTANIVDTPKIVDYASFIYRGDSLVTLYRGKKMSVGEIVLKDKITVTDKYNFTRKIFKKFKIVGIIILLVLFFGLIIYFKK